MFRNGRGNVTILALLSVIWICSARLQFYTFFSGTNFSGDSLTIHSNHPNTPYIMDFVRKARSCKTLGFWLITDQVNHTGDGYGWNSGMVEHSRNDSNFDWVTTGSIRHLGDVDMSRQAIWLYSGISLAGQEKVITTPASNDYTFIPRSLVTTGFSNWTLFTGKNFDGVTTCFVSTMEVESVFIVNSTLSNIGSVLRGCLGRINSYQYGGDTLI